MNAYIFPKPSMVPESITEYYTDTVYLDFYGEGFDMHASFPLFKRHDDGMYYQGGIQAKNVKDIIFSDGPEKGRVVGCLFSNRFNYMTEIEKGIIDNCLFAMPATIMETDKPHVFSYLDYASVAIMKYYAEINCLPAERCFVVLFDELKKEILSEKISLQDAWDFVKERDLTDKELIKPVNDIRRLMYEARMPVKHFAEYFGISRRTVENWLQRNSYPKWAIPLFELKLLTDRKI